VKSKSKFVLIIFESNRVHLDVKKVEEKPQSKGFFGNIFSRSNQNKEPSLADKYDEKLDSLTSSVRMSHNYDKGKSDFTYVIEKNEINQFGRTFLPQVYTIELGIII